MIEMIMSIALLVVMVLLLIAAIGHWLDYRADHTRKYMWAKEVTGGFCRECDHPFGDHMLLNRTGDPFDGGDMICPFDGCSCTSTWSVTPGPLKISQKDSS